MRTFAMQFIHMATEGGLLLKSIAGMLFLLIVMGVVLFLPYGSMHYTLAWWYLAAFFAPVLAITLYLYQADKRLLQSRLAAGPVAEPTVFQKVIQAIAALAFLGIYIVSALDYRHEWTTIPYRVSYTADVGCLLSFVLLFFVFRQNTYLSATIEVQAQQQVVSTGLYGLVRHPMYTGALVLMWCTPPALGSLWGLVPAAILTITIYFRALDEEQQLQQQLQGYKDYCQRVRYRFIPFVF
jgi:protein-S-isoprenylcysteine O-methyltransferase Ste14